MTIQNNFEPSMLRLIDPTNISTNQAKTITPSPCALDDQADLKAHK
jgi:hypothetical protein